MSRTLRYSLLAAALVLLLAAGGVAWLLVNVHAWMTEDVEQALSEALGREVRIDGGLLVDFGRSTVVTVKDFSIAAPGWSAEPKLLSVGHADAVIDTMSYFSDTVIIEALAIEGMAIALERHAEYGPNWQFADASGPQSEPATELPFRIDDLEVTSSSLVYRTPALGRPLELVIETLRQAMSPDASAALTLAGTINSARTEMAVELADMVALSRLEEVSVEFGGTVGDITLTGSADIDSLARPRRPAASLRIEGPGARYLGDLLSIPDLDSGDLTLDFDIEPDGERMRVDVDATVGRFHVAADAHFDDLQELGSASVNLKAEGPDADRFASVFGIADVPAEAYSLTVRATLEERVVDVPEFAATLGPTQFRGTAHFDNFPDPAGAHVDIHAAGPGIETFGALTGAGDRLRGPFELDLDMTAAGGGGADLLVDLEAAGASLRASGPIRRDSATLAVSLTTADTAAVLTNLDIPVARIPPEPLRLSGNADITTSGVTLRGWQATLGETRAMLSSLSATFGAQPTLRVQGSVRGPDAAAWAPILEGRVGEPGDFRLRADVEWGSDGLTLREFEGYVGAIDIAANGVLGRIGDGELKRFDFSARTDDVSRWSAIAGHELPVEAAGVELRLARTPGGVVAETFDIHLGHNRVTGDLEFVREPEDRLILHLQADRLDLRRYMPATSDAMSDAVPTTNEIASPADRRYLIPETPVPTLPLEKLAVEASVDIAELELRHTKYRDLQLAGALEDGNLELERFAFLGKLGGRMNGSARYSIGPDTATFRLELTGTGGKFGLPAVSPADYEALPAYDVDIGVAASGSTIREMAGSLNGYFRMYAGAGRIRTGMLRILSQDFVMQLLQAINPFLHEDPYADVECLGAFTLFEDGVISGTPVFLGRSDKLQIAGGGTLDLKSESIDADINTIARKGLGISLSDLLHPYVSIGGTLASPALILDPQKALVEGGAAVATGGLSVIAKNIYGRFFSGKDPCRKLLDDRDEDFVAARAKFQRLAAADE
jgi:uncharacterized protein involved in outer membrane biogenesis